MADSNFVKVLRCLIEGKQAIENAFQQLLVGRTLDAAEGVQLDIIGKIVGQPRGGLDDELYRRILRARIAANFSDGNVPDMLRVVKLVINDDATSYVHFQNHEFATQVVEIEAVAVSDALATLLMSLVLDSQAAGVRTIVIYGAEPPANWFRWDTAQPQGWDQGEFTNALDGTEP